MIHTSPIPASSHLMIIGAMKCGTSSLFEYLKSHPSICPSIKKEPRYFAIAECPGINVKHYHELFHFNASKHKYAMEASTAYTKYPEEPDVPKKIYEYGLNPKFIYSVRNPFDRIESQFEFVRDIPNFPKFKIDNIYFTDFSNYYMQLELFRKYFPKESILIIDFDDIVTKPSLVLSKIYNFLEISTDYIPDEFPVVNKSIMRHGIIHYCRLHFPTVLNLLPAKLRKTTKQKIQKHMPAKQRKLNGQERIKIFNELNKDMQKFGKEYNFNISKWGF